MSGAGPGSGRLPSSLVAGLGRRVRPPQDLEEHCDICGVTLDVEHRHMLDTQERRILCSCEVCIAMQAGRDGLRPVGTRTVWLGDLDFSDELWAAFGLPIGLAFFFRSSSTQTVVALYPSPAGATESELDMHAWEQLLARNPVLRDLEADAEALVVNRMGDGGGRDPDYAIVPMDECYRLVGLIKSTWQGISGGTSIEDAVPGFFAEVRERAVAAA